MSRLMVSRGIFLRTISAFLLLVGSCSGGLAQDTLRIAAGLAGTWENSFSELGQNAGFFKKRGLALEIFYTQGAGETQQAVISGSADIGTGVGAFNTFGAFAKGAPIRVIAATHTGANDLTWYVRSESAIRDKKDLAGRTVAYSTTGSSTYATVLAFQRVFGVTFSPVATGSPASTLTQVMSGQIDVGWTSPPFALDLLNEGKIRLIARASDIPEMRNQTVRFMTANLTALEARKPVFVRYLEAYREVIDWMYSNRRRGQGLRRLGSRCATNREDGPRRLLSEKQRLARPHRGHRAADGRCRLLQVPRRAALPGSACKAAARSPEGRGAGHKMR